MIMLALNGNEHLLFGRNFDEVMGLIKHAARPITLSFVKSPDIMIDLPTFPHSMMLAGKYKKFITFFRLKTKTTKQPNTLSYRYFIIKLVL